ncbi:MAG: Gfo/Idh/MocA family oxidoreductase [Ruminococcaceae bacterium]|nr:Gfo/Idh/MocA family oxidoreductase [Oscillospiraceae bacterium]
MIKVGLIGCGFMGGMHAACYQALESLGVRVVAVADPRESFAKDAAAKSGAEIYQYGMDLIAKADVDVVDICLPTDMHVAHAVAAMRAGKHVFIEKPVCKNEDEMELLLKVEAETGVKVQIGQVIRQWSEYKWLKATVDAGTYGKVLSGSFRRLSSRPTWASDGWLLDVNRSGVVAVDMHVHDADFIRYLMGEPTSVKSQASRDENGVIMHIMTLYGFENGAAIYSEACWDLPKDYPFTAVYQLRMEKATIIHDGGITVYPEDGSAPFKPELPKEYVADNDIGGNISDLGGYYNELKYFIEGLQGKNDLSVATAAEAVKSVKLVLREAEAAGGLVSK